MELVFHRTQSGAYTFTDIETSTLLFALETIDASRFMGLNWSFKSKLIKLRYS